MCLGHVVTWSGLQGLLCATWCIATKKATQKRHAADHGDGPSAPTTSPQTTHLHLINVGPCLRGKRVDVSPQDWSVWGPSLGFFPVWFFSRNKLGKRGLASSANFKVRQRHEMAVRGVKCHGPCSGWGPRRGNRDLQRKGFGIAANQFCCQPNLGFAPAPRLERNGDALRQMQPRVVRGL